MVARLDKTMKVSSVQKGNDVKSGTISVLSEVIIIVLPFTEIQSAEGTRIQVCCLTR